eukprot:GHVQ01025781.1.p2 GENE.GHVQ01025781.1~~GHVQ01025781.1.p2  ORF type:complete len:301 (-),score=39.57 GHVQ01025781.1:1196-2098(-)
MNITWPMLFEMLNPRTDRMTHSGVLEFIAEEGTCYMPYWMMQNLVLKEGDIVQVANISLPKGQYVKLQPVTKDFLDVSNPRAILENALRNYATLTVGDNVVIHYLDKTYEIEVVELKPAPAVSIIETDIQVDFQLKESLEPSPTSSQPESSMVEENATTNDQKPTQSDSAAALFQGAGMRLDGKASRASSFRSSEQAGPSQSGSRKMSNQFDLSRSGSQAVVPEVEEEPWRTRLPGGVRTFDAEYNAMVREGRVPGIIGKVKTRGMGTTENKNESSSAALDGASSTDPNFKLFGGSGNRC